MVAVSQAPSSEIEVRVLPSGETCRSDQPPKWRELAVIMRPPRQTRRPMVLADGSSILKGCEELLISSGCSCATAGGGEAPAQAVGEQADDEQRAERSERKRQAARRPDLPAPPLAALGLVRWPRAARTALASSSSNSEASCSIIVPPSCSASTMVTARR